MARRTQLFQIIPWNGGLNTAVDPGIIPSTDLEIADNVIFTSSGARIKREGLTYFDLASDIPNVITRSSSGTTKTLVFDDTLTDASRDKLIVGENINVTTTNSAAESTYVVSGATVATITTTTVTNDTITYTGSGSLTEGATATTTITAKRANGLIELKDYWYTDGSFVQNQRLMGFTDQSLVFWYDGDGDRKNVPKDGTATAWTGTIDRIDTAVMNNSILFTANGSSNSIKKYNPVTSANWFDVGGSPPNATFLQHHLNRIWCNDEQNPSRLHYSSTGNFEEWEGVGDSGALDIDPGDGDSSGITAIFAPFKDSIFVAKKNRLYRIVGNTPEDFQVIPISNGIGAESHSAVVPVDQDDIMYMSNKGFHSLAATNQFGDFSSSFLSAKIQPSFRGFNPLELKRSHGIYVPSINSVMFTVSDDQETSASQVWAYNIQVQEWYRWPNISCESAATRNVNEVLKPVFGTSDGRIIQGLNGSNTDFTSDGIRMRIKTGSLYPNNDPNSLKFFKKLTFLFRPIGNYSFVARVRIDNYPEQALLYNQQFQGDQLGIDFVLGQSILGFDQKFAPFTNQMDGLGRGMTIDLEQTGTDQSVEIYGLIIEYENADINQETIVSVDSD